MSSMRLTHTSVVMCGPWAAARPHEQRTRRRRVVLACERFPNRTAEKRRRSGVDERQNRVEAQDLEHPLYRAVAADDAKGDALLLRHPGGAHDHADAGAV